MSVRVYRTERQMGDLRAEAHDELLKRIAAIAKNTTNATVLLKLAEAYAWVSSPNQPHGGTVTTS